MNKLKFACLAWALTAGIAAQAGGILTNTNQSVAFLRNPARDAAIGLDGVYSNPAGVIFLGDGLHLGFNWQYAHQTRTIESQNQLFKLGYKNNGLDTKEFEGVANAPIIPSLQAAYNKGNWSFQMNFSVPGGGGKCEFDKGIGSFETVVGGIASRLQMTSAALNDNFGMFGCNVPNVTGYDVDGYMKGKQYYFGLQIGAARKIGEHLSVYGGLRLLYGTASYEARLNNIRVMTNNGGITLPEYFEDITNGLTTAAVNLKGHPEVYIQGLMQKGMSLEQAQQTLATAGAQLQATADQLKASGETLAPYSKGVNLKSDQTGWGIAPVIGIDYKTGAFNFAAKYEFKTRMRMKNDSDLEEASVISATNKYVNGTSVPEDSPAQLTLGAQWSITDNVRLNAGYHHFFDKSAHWYQHSEKLLDSDTNEYLGGAEWDINDKLQVSGGVQLTRYGLTDEYMNDMSFVVNSWTFGLGAGYKVSDKVKINVAYFQTNYEHYDMNTPEQNMQSLGLNIPAGKNSFTRTNNVFGVCVELTL